MSTTRRAVLRAAGVGGVGLLAVLTGCAPEHRAAAPTSVSTPTPRVTLTLADGSRDGAVTGTLPRLLASVTTGGPVHVEVTDADGAPVDGTTGPAATTTTTPSASSSTTAAAAANAHTWTPTKALTAGGTYTAKASVTRSGGSPLTATLTFTVAAADKLLGAKMMPLDGETVGVGMPVVVMLSAAVPTTDRAALAKAMTVTTEGAAVTGAWRWISGSEVHWRPREYWPSGTRVHVDVPLSGRKVADLVGTADRSITFTVGDAHISIADTDTHQMTTSVNGTVVKTTPISAGREDADPHFVTRSGPHVVTEKYASYFMDGATVGLDYAETVQWATRIANSGEFVHAAPWSVAQQGHANVSHGCINVSPDDAHWFYTLARRGDIVDVRGTDRPLELTNGLGDWTLSWDEWTAPQT